MPRRSHQTIYPFTPLKGHRTILRSLPKNWVLSRLSLVDMIGEVRLFIVLLNGETEQEM